MRIQIQTQIRTQIKLQVIGAAYGYRNVKPSALTVNSSAPHALQLVRIEAILYIAFSNTWTIVSEQLRSGHGASLVDSLVAWSMGKTLADIAYSFRIDAQE